MSQRRYATDGGEQLDDYPTVRNEERGCGFLEHGKAYLRSPPASASGHLPAFVEFSPPVPYLERDKFRGYEFFPGVQFELAVTGVLGEEIGNRYSPSLDSPPEFRDPDEAAEAVADRTLNDSRGGGITTTDPVGEVHRHVSRLVGSGDGNHAGEFAAFTSHDLYQHIGASYYETPEEFVEEVREQGLSKAIPASSSHEPPRIDAGKTRLFLVHPNATAENEPGVIGYVYLHRTIYTETKSGELPAWVQEEAAGRDDFEPVHVGDRIHDDGKRATKINGGEEWTEIDEKDADDLRAEEESEAEAAMRNLPQKVVPSDKPGRDVEGVPVEPDETDDDGIPLEWGGDEDSPPGIEDDETDEETPEAEAEPAEGSQDTDEDKPEETPTADDEDDAEQDDADDSPNTDPFDEAEVVEVPRPEECPECETTVSIGTMRTEDYDDVEVRMCREGCNSWDNASDRRLL